jgi:hypothetical protein
MLLDSFLDRLAGQPAIPRRKKRLRPARFHLEALENRALLAGFTVNSTSPGVGGSGANTLVEAIGLANLDTGDSSPFVIDFNIPKSDLGYNSATGVWTIDALDLPTITHQVTINGETQSGWSSGHPVINIDGTQATSTNQSAGVHRRRQTPSKG